MNSRMATGIIKLLPNGEPNLELTSGLPFEAEEEVYLIEQNHYHKIVGDGLRLLEDSKISMQEALFNQFPDPLVFTLPVYDKTGPLKRDTFRLNLSRYFYTFDPGKKLYIKYESVANAIEEGDLNRALGEFPADYIEEDILEDYDASHGEGSDWQSDFDPEEDKE